MQAGIAPGDLLIVDCSRQAVSGSIVVAILDGELTVKQLWLERGTGVVLLKSANPRFPDFRIPQLSELTVWGVVTHCIHRFTSA
jgi:DNA polymerase V